MPKQIQYQVNVGIVGLTPLLHHKCGEIKGKVSSATTNYDKEWMDTTYIERVSGFVIAPSINIEAMMRDAAKGHKIKKMALTRIVTSGSEVVEFESIIKINDRPIKLDDIEKNDWLFTCPVVIKTDRVMRTRTSLPIGWAIDFNIRVTNPLLNPEILRDLLDRGGCEQGLMDWRPGAKKPGKFGQFEVVEFEMNEG